MSKITLSRIFEVSKVLATKVGQEIPDFVTFIAEFAEQTLRTLRNGLTFEDNISCIVKTVTLQNFVTQEINVSGKKPIGMIVTRVLNPILIRVADGWYIDSLGKLQVTVAVAQIGGAAFNDPFEVTLVILF